MQSSPSATGKHEISLSPEEKEALLANLDARVKERVAQLDVWLDEATAGFRNHLESILSNIPPTVRGITMRDLADKYGGDIKACVEALAIENSDKNPIVPAVEKLTVRFAPLPPSAKTTPGIRKRKRKVPADHSKQTRAWRPGTGVFD